MQGRRMSSTLAMLTRPMPLEAFVKVRGPRLLGDFPQDRCLARL